MSFQEVDWYDTPRYYDLVFDTGTAEEADFLEGAHRRYGKTRGKRVLEPACGSGRLVVEMAKRGWNVTGFDLSEPMLDHGRKRLRGAKRKARLGLGRLESFEYRQPFDLAHCLICTFKYVLDEQGARGHLSSVARALKMWSICRLVRFFWSATTN